MSAEPARRGSYARFVALRFLRARRQGFLSLISLLSALGFLVGTASLIIALALMTGFQGEMMDRLLGANAHVIVRADGGWSVQNPDATADRLETVEGVVAASPVIVHKGLAVSRAGLTREVFLSGIVPARAVRVTDIEEQMVSGSLLDLTKETTSGRTPVVLGQQLADDLAVLEGDTLTIGLPQVRATLAGLRLRRLHLEVVGVFHTGYAEYDKTWAYVPYTRAVDYASQRGAGADWVAARIEDLSRLKAVEDRVRNELGDSFVVQDLFDANSQLLSALKIEKLLTFLTIGLIMLVAALSVVSTLVLTVTQRVREIGVLSAIGASPVGILRTFVIQGSAMGLLGTAVGGALAVVACWLLDKYRVIKLDPDVYLLDHLPFTVHASDALAVVAVAAVISVLATLYPAWRASRLDPVEALRGE